MDICTIPPARLDDRLPSRPFSGGNITGAQQHTVLYRGVVGFS